MRKLADNPLAVMLLNAPTCDGSSAIGPILRGPTVRVSREYLRVLWIR
jgi:hypothetical protein